MDGKTKLTIKQEKFCLKYLECGNASEAYRYAYRCGKSTDKLVWESSSKLLNSPKVATRVKELQQATQQQSEITKERILNEFAKVGFSSVAHLHNTWIDRKAFEELTEDQKAAIKSIATRTRKIRVDDEPVEVEEVKIELYDKLRALDSICKMLGYEAPTKHEISTGIMDLSRLSDAELDVYYSLIQKAREQ